MKRRIAVLGLTVAMCVSVVSGQAEYRLNEIPPGALNVSGDAMGDLLRLMQRLRQTASSVSQAQLPGPLVVNVESVEPKFTRVHLTQHGRELATLESTAFTVTMGADGTTISASGRVKMKSASGRTLWTDDGLELRTGPAGDFTETSRTVSR